jgi:NAD(P)-dependent dehydrogenase (short-subunit alcohol dehydrogenase family)
LFQASFSLLKSSSSHPKFVIIGARGGSLAAPSSFPMFPYQTSKAAVNFVSRKLHFEHEGDGLGVLVAPSQIGLNADHADSAIFPICPGAVKTDLSEETA